MKKIILKNFRKYQRHIRSLIKSRWLITVLILLFLLVTSVGIINSAYVYYMEKNYVNVFEIKMLIVSYIKKKLHKAVEIGIVNFNMFEGVTFEDLRISAEEDFSNNKIFFQCQRVDIRFSSLFGKQLGIEKIIFHNSKLELDSEFSFSELTKEINASGFPSLEFRNIILIKRQEGKLLWKTHSPVNIFLQRKNTYYSVLVEDSWFFRIFSKLKGSGTLDLSKNSLELLLEFTNYPATSVSGSLEDLTYIQVDSGKLTGFFRILDSRDEKKIDGNFNLYSISGSLNGFEGLKLKDLPINCKFSYYKEIENENSEIYFQKKINNPSFYYNEFFYKSKDNIEKKIISTLFENFEKLSNSFEIEDEFKISGNLKLDLTIQDLAKGSEKFNIDGVLSVERLQISRKNPYLVFNLKEGGIRVNPNGGLAGNINFELFQKKGSFELNGKVQFLKSSTLDYQIFSDTNYTLKLEKVSILDVKEIYNSLKEYIENDIRERQEKMLPESYIIKDPIFQKFFEKANLKGDIFINSFKNNENSQHLGPLEIQTKYQNKTLNLEFISKVEKPFVKGNLKGVLEGSNPYFSFYLQLDNYPWGQPFINYCGYEFVPKVLNLNLSVQSSGNNFSDLTGRKSYTLSCEMLDTKFYSQGQSLEEIDSLFRNESLSIKGNRSGYALDGYFQGLEINSENLHFKGYGNITKTGEHVFNFWGTWNGKYISWNLTEQGEKKCQFIKK